MFAPIDELNPLHLNFLNKSTLSKTPTPENEHDLTGAVC
jgi:hypothetical protein